MSNNSLVFLDVDGILTYNDYKNNETENIDIEKVKLLKEICEETKASIVIISSWRGTEDWTPNVYYVLVNILKNNGINVLGDAPYIKTELLGEKPSNNSFSMDDLKDYHIKFGTGRGAEVQQYLKENPTNSFVILDDEDWEWKDYGLDTHWLRPSWYKNGLQKEHVKKAIKILKNK